MFFLSTGKRGEHPLLQAGWQKKYLSAPGYRRQGIAYKTLDLLVQDAKNRGITAISLEATDMGRPLYEKYGFVKMNDEMELR